MSRFAWLFFLMAWMMSANAEVESIPSSPSDVSPVQNMPQQPFVSQDQDVDVFINKMANAYGCRPIPSIGKTCEITVTNLQDSLTYLKYCFYLTGWKLHFNFSSMLSITMMTDSQTCNMTITDPRFQMTPPTITCKLTPSQLTEMIDQLSEGNTMSNFTSTGEVNQDIVMKSKPIGDCIRAVLAVRPAGTVKPATNNPPQ